MSTPTALSSLRITLIGLGGLAIAVGIGRFAFTPLLPMMQADGLVDVAGGGVLASAHFVGYLMGALTAAHVPASPRLLFRVSLAAIGLASLAMGFLEGLSLWLVIRWVAGVCSAWTLILVGTHCVKALADAGRSDRQGWVFSGVGAGIAVAGLVCFVLMMHGVSSLASWLLFGVLALVVAGVISIALGPEMPSVRPSSTVRAAERSPLDWTIVIAYGAAGLGYIIPGTYLPVMAREIVPSPSIFGWGWPVFGAAAFVSTLISAALHRRFSNRRIWSVSQLVMAVGLVLPAAVPHIATIILAGLCVGGTFMIITMAGLKEAHVVSTPTDAVRHVAIMTAAFAAGQMIGPVFAGLLYEASGGFALSLIVTAVVLVATAFALESRSAKAAPDRG